MNLYSTWPRPIDWPRVIVEARNGETLRSLARTLGMPESTLLSLMSRRVNPLYPNAERVIAHWIRVTGSTYDEIPRMPKLGD